MEEKKTQDVTVSDTAEPVVQTSYEPEYEIRRRHSVIPYLIVAAVWLLWALFLPLYNMAHWLCVLALSVLAGVMAARFCPVSEYRIPIHDKWQKSGVRDVDKILKKADGELKEAERAMKTIAGGNAAFADTIAHVIGYGYKLIGYLAQTPAHYPHLRRIFSYYIPELGKLLRSYITFAQHGVDGRDVGESMKNIETSVGAMETLFSHQLDKLFRDTELDISSDIDVLETMLARDGEETPKQESES